MKRLRRWSVGGALAVVGLITLDALCGLVYRSGTDARVTVTGARSSVARRAIVILPGYLMSGQLVGRAFAPYVAPDDALVSVDYAEHGVDIDDIYARVMAALGELRPTELRFYGASLGGMVSVLLADRYRRDGQPFGQPVLVLDSAPAEKRDLKRPGWLFPLSCRYRGGPVSTAVWAAASGVGAQPPLDSGADQTLVDAARHSGAWAGTPAATTQACFIGRFRAPPQAAGLVSDAVFLRTRCAADDPVVRIPQSITHWWTMFPQLAVVMLDGRVGRWHLPLVEQPRETVAAITATYS